MSCIFVTAILDPSPYLGPFDFQKSPQLNQIIVQPGGHHSDTEVFVLSGYVY